MGHRSAVTEYSVYIDEQQATCAKPNNHNIESEDKFVDGTYHSDENLLNNISTLNKHGA